MDDFLEFIKIEKGLSKNTYISYQNDLDIYYKYLTNNKIFELYSLYEGIKLSILVFIFDKYSKV